MSIFLQAVSGASSGRTVHLRYGENAKIGRTDNADISFPDDRDMSSLHFAMECHSTDCRIRSLTGTRSIVVDGSEVSEAILKAGDQFTAGSTTFEVFVGERPPKYDGPKQQEEEASDQISPLALCEYLDLDEESHPVAKTVKNADELLAALVENKLLPAALRLQAHLLAKDRCIQWGSECVRPLGHEKLSVADQDALQATNVWVATPNEESRRAAQLAAENSGFKGPGGWVAQAVFWSGGSLAPPERAVIVPDERLTGQAVTTALMLTAVLQNPTDISSEYHAFLQNVGRSASDGGTDASIDSTPQENGG